MTAFRHGAVLVLLAAAVEVYGDQCRSQPNSSMGTFADLLSDTERDQFNAWVKELGQVDLDASDPEGVSDRMEVNGVLRQWKRHAG